MPPLSAGAMFVRLQFQTLIGSTWTDYATTWAQPKGVELVGTLDSAVAARQQRTYAIRKRSTALPVPLRVLVAGRTMFAVAAVDDEVSRDQTEVTCIDALDMTAGSGGSGPAETVTLYRGTDTTETDGSSSRAWASTTTGLAILLEDSDQTILERLFGHETKATIRGIVPIESDVRLEDGIIVTAGRHAGQNYLVTARKIDPTLPGQAYYSLGLTLTAEAFV